MEEVEVVEDDLEVEAAAGVGVFMDEVLLKIELNFKSHNLFSFNISFSFQYVYTSIHGISTNTCYFSLFSIDRIQYVC